MVRSKSSLIALVACVGFIGPADAQRSDAVWTVCVPNMPVPPFILNIPEQPERLGTAELLALAAVRASGLRGELVHLPPARCRRLLEAGEADALMVSASGANLDSLQFPRDAKGQVDARRRLARLNLVWVSRPDSPFEWNGRELVGHAAGSILVGTRSPLLAATAPLVEFGFKVDGAAVTTPQVLRKLMAKRVDIAVVVQAELNAALEADPSLRVLHVLPRPFVSSDFHLAVRKSLSNEQRKRAEAVWAAIARLRNRPEFVAPPSASASAN